MNDAVDLGKRRARCRGRPVFRMARRQQGDEDDAEHNSRDWQPDPNKQWRSENLLVLHCDANEYRIGWVRRYARNGKLLSDTPGSNQFYRALPGSFEMTIVRTICSAQ